MKNYSNSIIINSSTDGIHQALTNKINDWWSNEFTGKASKLNDIFEVKFGSSFKKIIVGDITISQIKWKVIESFIDLPNIENKSEWNGTEIIWNIVSLKDSKSKLIITHIGLTKSLECYNACEIGWSTYLRSIKNLLENDGHY